jgi:hypothetical protein
VRSKCTQARQRSLSVRRQEAHFALDAARQQEKIEEFKQAYAKRAGVAGVHAQGTRRMGLRRSRYIGEPRTHLQHVVTATAMNVCRLHDWLEGVAPHVWPWKGAVLHHWDVREIAQAFPAHGTNLTRFADASACPFRSLTKQALFVPSSKGTSIDAQKLCPNVSPPVPKTVPPRFLSLISV